MIQKSVYFLIGIATIIFITIVNSSIAKQPIRGPVRVSTNLAARISSSRLSGFRRASECDLAAVLSKHVCIG